MLDAVRETETKWPIAVSSNNYSRRHILKGANIRLIQNIRSRIQHKNTHTLTKKYSINVAFLSSKISVLLRSKYRVLWTLKTEFSF